MFHVCLTPLIYVVIVGKRKRKDSISNIKKMKTGAKYFEEHRKDRRSADFNLSRGAELMAPITRSTSQAIADESRRQADHNLQSEAMDVAEAGAVGGQVAPNSLGAEPKRSSSTTAQYQQAPLDLQSELRAAINTALSEARETFQSVMATGMADLQAQNRREMLEYMKAIRESSLYTQLSGPKDVTQTDTAPPPNHRAEQQRKPPSAQGRWFDNRALDFEQREQAESLNFGARSEAQVRSIPTTRGSFGVADPRPETIPIRRWGLIFEASPNGMPVGEFIFRLEHLRQTYQVPWQDVLRDFHTLVEGRAKEWYWTFIRTRGSTDWPNLRYALQQRFQSRRSNFEREQELRERRQKSGESIDDFLQAMFALRSRLEVPVSDHDLIRIIKVNIRDGISRIIYPIWITDLEKLREECHDAERLLSSRWARSQTTTEPVGRSRERYQVHEALHEDKQVPTAIAPDESVEALSRPRGSSADSSMLTCWNCAQRGHTFWECEATVRNVFCYKCGLPGVVLPKCPKCRSGNGGRSLTQAEESRSVPKI